MTLSARNKLAGELVALKRDGLMAQVTVRVDGPVEITALVSAAAADDLALAVGDQVAAVIKATEVMIDK